jgi:hypothetical protein
MKWIRWLLLLGLLAVIAFPEALFAQNGGDKAGKDYRSLPLEGGAEALKNRLLEGEIFDDELAKALLKEMKKHPEKYKDLLDKSKQQPVKPGEVDPAKKQAEELAKNAGLDPKKLDPEKLQKVKQLYEKQALENKKNEFHPPVDPNEPKKPGDKIAPDSPKGPPPLAPPAPPKDPIGKATGNIVKDVENGKYGKFGEFLKKQNAWQKNKANLNGLGGGTNSSASEAALKNALGNMEHKAGGTKFPTTLPSLEGVKLLTGGDHQGSSTPQGGGAGHVGNLGSPAAPPSLGL